MRVLMILDEEFPPDVRVEKELKELGKNGYKIHLLVYTRKKQAFSESLNTVKIKRIFISKLLYKLKALALELPFYFNFWRKFIEDEICKHNFDVIHLHDLTLVSTVIKIGKKYNIPVIGDYHENRPEIMKMYDHVKSFPGNILISVKKWKKYQEKYTKQLDRLILVTKEAKEYYINNFGLKEENVFVVPNYVDIDEIANYNINKNIVRKYSEKFMLVYFGDTGTRRGTFTILAAAAELQRNNENDIHFVIIGNSREQGKLENEVDKLKLNNVELTGYIPLQKAVSYFSAADVGLCPFYRNIHHDTTYSNKMFQYMAFGKPVIVSDCPSQANIIKENDSGEIFTAGNSDMLIQKIFDLKNKKKYNLLSKNSIHCVKEKYNSAESAKELKKVYSSL